MDELFTVSIEFFIFNDELWYRSEGKSPCRLKEQDYEFVTLIANLIEKFYPKAYIALASEYAKSKANLPLFRYRIVSRFCRCNFGNIDNIIDIDASTFHFEHVLCPLRGECKFENIVCHPEFESHISKAEKRILERWYRGESKEEIADALFLSIHTINNHIRNAFQRLDIHNKAEFVRFTDLNNLFK